MILYADCGGTAFWQWKLPRWDQEQPHLVRFSALLEGDDGRVLERVSMVVRPMRGWEAIAPKATAIHGVTDEIARDKGFDISLVVGRIGAMLADRPLMVAHNAEYHRRLIERAFGDLGVPLPPTLSNLSTRCTMRESAHMVQASLQGNGRWRWPSLAAAFQHFTGLELVEPDDPVERGNAHVAAVRAIYAGMTGRRAARRASAA